MYDCEMSVTSFMSDVYYIQMCKMIKKGFNNVSDEDIRIFQHSYQKTLPIVKEDENFKAVYDAIVNVHTIHDYILGSRLKSFYTWCMNAKLHDNRYLEDLIFDTIDVLDILLDNEIQSNIVNLIISHGFALSKLNTQPFEAPEPSNMRIMEFSIYELMLQDMNTPTRDLMDTWMYLWNLTTSHFTLSDETIASMMVRQIRRIQEQNKVMYYRNSDVTHGPPFQNNETRNG